MNSIRHFRNKTLSAPLDHFLDVFNVHLLALLTLSLSSLALVVSCQRDSAANNNDFDVSKLSSLEYWQNAHFRGGKAAREKDSKIVIPAGDFLSGVRIVDASALPQINYEIELQARKVSGSDFFCALTFPVGKVERIKQAGELSYVNQCATLIIGGWGGGVTGISCLDGLDASENSSTKYRAFQRNRWYAIRLRVTKASIEAWINGGKIVDENIHERQISLRLGDIDHCAPWGIATYQSEGHFRAITLRKLSKKEIEEALASRPIIPKIEYPHY